MPNELNETAKQEETTMQNELEETADLEKTANSTKGREQGGAKVTTERCGGDREVRLQAGIAPSSTSKHRGWGCGWTKMDTSTSWCLHI